MTPTSSRLYGVLRPIPAESPTSWVQRICQQYDLTYSRFLACIGKSPAQDIDLALQPKDYLALSTMCGIELAAFDWMRQSLGRCAWMRELQELLRYRGKLLPSYRFCSLCWRTDSVPFLRLEWRFARWTICPTHRVPMSECCPTCREPLQMQRAVLGGSSRVVNSLASCYCCGADMRLYVPPKFSPDPVDKLAQIINTQRSIVSAVVHGYFHIDCFGERALPVKRLPPWVRHGVLEGVPCDGLIALSPVRFEKLGAESRRLEGRMDRLLERRSCASSPFDERIRASRRLRATGLVFKQERRRGRKMRPEPFSQDPSMTTPSQRTQALSMGMELLAGLPAHPDVASDVQSRALAILEGYPTSTAINEWLTNGLQSLPQGAAAAIDAASSLFLELRWRAFLNVDLQHQLDAVLSHFPPVGTAANAASLGFFGGIGEWLAQGPTC